MRRPLLSLASALVACGLGVTATVPTTASFADPGTVGTALRSADVSRLAFTELSAGQDHTLALRDDGRLYAWGAGAQGQLGDGTTSSRPAPVEVELPDGVQVADFAAGARVSIALTTTGQVYTWGDAGAGASPTPQVVAGAWGTPAGVSAGGVFFLVWNTSGELYTWGSNGSGRLGRGTINVDDLTPARATAGGVSGIVGADGGRYGGVAWRANGTVYAWGNTLGEVAGRTMSGVPTGPIAEVDLGYDVSLLRHADGRVFTSIAGGAYAVQGGLPTDTVDVSVSLAESHGSQTYLVATRSGQVWGWLDNSSGQLGTGSTGTNAPVQRLDLASFAGVTDPVGVASGDRHAVVLTAEGLYTSAGANSQGELGLGTTTSYTRFRPPPSWLGWG